MTTTTGNINDFKYTTNLSTNYDTKTNTKTNIFEFEVFSTSQELKYVCDVEFASIYDTIKIEYKDDYEFYNIITNLLKEGTDIVFEFFNNESIQELKTEEELKITFKLVNTQLMKIVFRLTMSKQELSEQEIMECKLYKLEKELKTINMKHDEELKKTKSYATNKKLSILYCQKLIEKNISYLKFFDENKKKDDLADSFLQGYYFISKNHGYINICEQTCLIKPA